MNATVIAGRMVLVLLVAGTACTPSRPLAKRLQLDLSPDDSTKVITLPYFWSGRWENGRTEAWLEPGAIVAADNGPYLLLLPGDSGVLRLEFSDWSLRLAGRIVSLDVGKDSAAAWLAGASKGDLADLRMVVVPDSISAGSNAAIERLASVRPDVALYFSGREHLEWTLQRFHPRWLSLPEGDEGFASLLAGQLQVEQLLIPTADSLAALPYLPQLRSLFVIDGDIDLPTHLPRQLEDLTVMDVDINMSVVDSLSRLTALRLTASRWTGASDLAAMHRLRWVGFPTNATQEEFAAIIRAHPDLEVLELIGTDSVTDLSPLRGAKRLRAIVLEGEFANLSVLQELKTLEYVGFSDSMITNAPEVVAAIRAALPGAAVVETTAFCLGSGWILLLLPVVLLTVATRRRERAG